MLWSHYYRIFSIRALQILLKIVLKFFELIRSNLIVLTFWFLCFIIFFFLILLGRALLHIPKKHSKRIQFFGYVHNWFLLDRFFEIWIILILSNVLLSFRSFILVYNIDSGVSFDRAYLVTCFYVDRMVGISIELNLHFF